MFCFGAIPDQFKFVGEDEKWALVIAHFKTVRRNIATEQKKARDKQLRMDEREAKADERKRKAAEEADKDKSLRSLHVT